jgi:hypothetical protein
MGFIEHFPSWGFDTTSIHPAGLSSPNLTSTLPLMPVPDVPGLSCSAGASQLLDEFLVP